MRDFAARCKWAALSIQQTRYRWSAGLYSSHQRRECSELTAGYWCVCKLGAIEQSKDLSGEASRAIEGELGASWLIELRFYVPLGKNRSFLQRRSFQPICWRSTEETKPITQQKQTTREQNTENSLSQNRKTHKMLNVSKRTETKPINPNQHSTVRTADVCVPIIVHNCCTQHST